MDVREVRLDLEEATALLRAELPPLYATEGETDPIAWYRLTTETGEWEWFPLEIDEEDLDLCYGLIVRHDEDSEELGFFRLSALATLGVSVVLDRRFLPTGLSVLHAIPESESRYSVYE